MCGRFAMEEMLNDMVAEFGLKGLPDRELPLDWNIKPTQDVYVIKNETLEITSWGLIASWSKTNAEALKSQSIAINARSETVHEKPTFRHAFRKSRCLVPASGYFEWATELGRYKPRQPIYISRDDDKMLAFAGIQDQWVSPDGEIRSSVAILTREAVGDLAKAHHRMPMFLPRDRWEAWMDPALRDLDKVRTLFDNFQPDAHLRFWTVSDAVNSIKSSGLGLIEPVDVMPETLF
ncbi:MAG: SOS response-associated peptidase [Micrococcales bacterium]|nr:SOS response-associated peptidase [Micrococcales bacterium]